MMRSLTTLPLSPGRLLTTLILTLIAYGLTGDNVIGQIDSCIRVTAATSTTTPSITLKWPTITYNTGSISIWRRVKGATSWGTAITIPSSSTSYADNSAELGVCYEYSLQCARAAANQTTAYGAIVAGSNIPLVENRGNVILLVDSTMTTTLSPEISQLQQNLVADGWVIFRHDVARQSILATSTNSADYAPRLAELQAVRTLVQNDYNNNGGGANWALFILGHVPVPYSGNINPDGHGEHQGAWPTDSYYADVNGTWTDTSVNSTSNYTKATDNRTINVPGDGKFDQGTLPSVTELQCGRVDLANMANEPTGMTEVALLRQYLVRDHRFRRNLAPYNTVARRGLIDDNFNGYAGEQFASSGWRAIISLFGSNPGQVDELDWFDTLGTTPMLMAYSCGAGSYTGSRGVGSSFTDFNQRDSKAVFAMEFGSFFGDWDITDSFLRSPLAGTANSLGLTSVWSGRGYYQLFHMGLGEVIGYSNRFTQNFNEYTGNGGWPSNSYYRYLSYNLMGDPTLRLHSIAPPAKVTATSSPGSITLNWLASPDTTLSGYHVYRSTSANGPFTRITGSPAIVNATISNPTGSCLSTGTLTYTDTDSSLVAGTTYTYLVKAVRMETSASGTYANQSLGEMVSVAYQSATPAPSAPTRLVVTRTGTTTNLLNWDDNSSDESGYLVERCDPATGIWSQIKSLSADSTSTTDATAAVAQVIHYRVRASGSSANSAYSNATADYTLPGLVTNNLFTFTVNKTAGSVTPLLTRFNGNTGDVSVNYTLSDLLSTAGADYTSSTGTITWAHGESGSKGFTIPILNNTSQTMTRIFKVAYNNPTNGLAFNSLPSTYVFINNPATLTLPNGWLTTTFGTVASGEEGYAEYDNGTFGIAVRSDAELIWGSKTSDSARFVYQPITGDCQITARLKLFTNTISPNLNCGVMIRASLNADSVMDSFLQFPGQTTAFRGNRTSTGGSFNYSLPGTVVWPGLKAPLSVWMRLTRTGNTINISTSADGTTWTTHTTDVTLSGLGSTAYVGLYLSSGTTAFPGGPSAYAQYDNVTLYSVPATVTTLTASTTTATQSGQIALSWTNASAATTYLIERSTTAGSGYTQIAQSSGTAYTDSSLTAGQTYYYRVIASNPAYQASGYSPVTSATPYLPPTVNGWRYANFGTESNTGNAADLATPNGDGITNVMAYALGLSAKTPNSPSSLPHIQTQSSAGTPYLTCTFTHNKASTDLQITVQVASDVNGPWTPIDPLSAANQISVADNTPTPGVETIVVKDTQPVSASTKRFMRFMLTLP